MIAMRWTSLPNVLSAWWICDIFLRVERFGVSQPRVSEERREVRLRYGTVIFFGDNLLEEDLHNYVV